MFTRKILLRLLTFGQYLRLISYIFLKTFRLKLFLPDHRQVRFLAELVKEGDYCVDIGANLGYFTIPLSRYVGKTGKVVAVEPVPTFRTVLEENVRRFALENVGVMPYALGAEDGKEVILQTPMVDGVVRHGRTEISEVATHEQAAFEHKATMMRPETAFADLPRIDYLKCDVEGYELHIVPHLLSLIKKHRPTIEIEVDTLENKRQILGMLQPLGYQVYFLKEGKLHPFSIETPQHQTEIELYFLFEKSGKNH